LFELGCERDGLRGRKEAGREFSTRRGIILGWRPNGCQRFFSAANPLEEFTIGNAPFSRCFLVKDRSGK
jgi:hypothetical protein